MDELRNTLLMLSVYLKGVWIKKRYIIISTWLICPIGLALMATKPDTYQSTAKVYADTKSILTPLLSGLAVQTNPDSEIQLIAKTLLSRPNIEEIARETDMDILVTDARAYENLITGLSKSIRLRGTGRQNIYTISYSNADPQVAKKIVTATLNKFVETTLGQNRDESDTATKFLEEQINDYEKRLEAAEQRLTEFKRNYVGLMPGSGDYYSGVASLTKQVEDIDLEILEKQTMLKGVKDRILATTSAENATAEGNIETQYDERIDLLTESLDDLLVRFTENHPEVKETERRLAHLKKQRKAELQDMVTMTAEGNIPTGALSDNVVIQQLSISINELESDISSLKVRRKKFKSELESLNEKVYLMPEIEAKLSGLNRDYSLNKKKYQELLSRRDSAELSRKAEQSAEEIQFKVIEPPIAPLTPTGPNRKLFYTIVLVLGFGVGIGVAFLISQISPVITSVSQLKVLTGRPVFGFVSDADYERKKGKERRNLYVFITSCAFIIGIYLIFIISEIKYGQSFITKFANSSYVDMLKGLLERLV